MRITGRAGLIPARAGTTLRRLVHSGRGWAHPRSRGDHNRALRVLAEPSGSSPLARGPQQGLEGLSGTFGLIPARAGTTTVYEDIFQFSWAHPRSRGDHVRSLHLKERELGSSPLARGPHGAVRRGKRTRGLIPARAGTTALFLRTIKSAGAHPRSRGDHLCILRRIPIIGGSSPLARGPLHGFLIDFNNHGLIPARAGTTSAVTLTVLG